MIDPRFDWQDDRPPNTPLADSVIYETHVKGFTMQHPDVREDLRGTYAGMASDAAVGYLKELGVTAIELLPVHHIADEAFLADRGLTNYWGYSTIGFLAPHSPYAATGKAGQEVREFKGMVKALHKAGIEVILDVVYNHTAEGNHLGPMLSFRGVDNAAYYRLVPDDLRHYMDYTGTGNTLNVMHPSVLRLIMDSLRYWVIDCHVDGFRFDLASALARELYDVDRLSAFFDVIHQDPVLSQVKLIAEPWDVGPGGYQVGNFPVLWSEWNGIYRDTMRDFWRGEAHVGEFAQRLTGSSDLYQDDGRHPFASINFITAHDGFPLRDLVSYNEKHNEANKEDNRDGTDDNRSWNCGAEGRPTTPRSSRCAPASSATSWPRCCSRRARRCCSAATSSGARRAATTTAGARTPRSPGSTGRCSRPTQTLLEFTRKLIALRRAHAVFRRRQFLFGREVEGSGLPDAAWFRSGRRADARRGVGRLAAGRRRLPQRRGDRLAGLARAPGARRVVPAAVQRATTRTTRSRCPSGRSGRRGRWCSTPADDDAEAVETSRPAPRSTWSTTRWCCCAASRNDGASGRRTGCSWAAASASPRPRALVPYLARLGVSHVYLPPSFQAREGSTHGYDVVDPSSISNELGGQEAFDALVARRARGAGLGIVLDIVPNHMATDDANRFWADRTLREQFFDIDAVTGPPPALLRRRPPGRAAPGGPGGLRGDARAGAAARARGRRRRAADRPSGRARRPGGLPGSGCVTAASSTCGWRRSSTPASRCATGRSTARSATSSSTTSARCSSTRRARRR